MRIGDILSYWIMYSIKTISNIMYMLYENTCRCFVQVQMTREAAIAQTTVASSNQSRALTLLLDASGTFCRGVGAGTEKILSAGNTHGSKEYNTPSVAYTVL